MPVTEPDLRRLGRAMGHRTKPEQAVVADRQASAREVRRLHERLFYRPLLAAAAKLSPSEVRAVARMRRGSDCSPSASATRPARCATSRR